VPLAPLANRAAALVVRQQHELTDRVGRCGYARCRRLKRLKLLVQARGVLLQRRNGQVLPRVRRRLGAKPGGPARGPHGRGVDAQHGGLGAEGVQKVARVVQQLVQQVVDAVCVGLPVREAARGPQLGHGVSLSLAQHRERAVRSFEGQAVRLCQARQRARLLGQGGDLGDGGTQRVHLRRQLGGIAFGLCLQVVELGENIVQRQSNLLQGEPRKLFGSMHLCRRPLGAPRLGVVVVG